MARAASVSNCRSATRKAEPGVSLRGERLIPHILAHAPDPIKRRNVTNHPIVPQPPGLAGVYCLMPVSRAFGFSIRRGSGRNALYLHPCRRSAAFWSMPAYPADRANRRDKLILMRADQRGRFAIMTSLQSTPSFCRPACPEPRHSSQDALLWCPRSCCD